MREASSMSEMENQKKPSISAHQKTSLTSPGAGNGNGNDNDFL